MKTLLLFCIFGTLGSICFANEKRLCSDCSFTGIVIDATSKKPMADVTIVAKAASSNNEQKVVTNEQGQFAIPSLPAGTYTLRFEKNNYKSVEKKNLVVKNTSSKLNIELLVNETKEENHHNWLLKI
ncbi:MAG TPA: carboxypeptidase-like regulatory domain-containing protein, partial [Chitinophagaceae bacterium]